MYSILSNNGRAVKVFGYLKKLPRELFVYLLSFFLKVKRLILRGFSSPLKIRLMFSACFMIVSAENRLFLFLEVILSIEN